MDLSIFEFQEIGLIFSGVLLGLAFGYVGVPFFLWSCLIGVCLWLVVGVSPIFWLFILFGLIFNIKPVRTILVSGPILGLMKRFKILPKISATEKTALEAGVVWIESELFSGKPCFKKVWSEPYPSLTAEEQAFIDGPVEKLCQAINEDKVWKDKDIPKEAWDIMKKEKFLGMIIPKEYGGLGFSAMANSEVIMKLASRSIPTAVTVMVPNSLGPAELLVHYGTEQQKKRFLPRLAIGDEIPCFALTEPHAGSDAGGIRSEGVLFKKDGQILMRLNWEKRYITLASIASIVGLAFKLRDPENILGKGESLGITCALIPASTPGVQLGLQHDPLGVPFYNCPTNGINVEVIVEDCVIGGCEGVGKGWGMLMECLAAGRGISLPAQSTGGSKLCARTISTWGVLRKQFGVSIGKFEGIEEPMSRIGSMVYLLEAARKFTCGALDKGIKPPVITAIAKYQFTEIARQIINDAMDIQSGSAISKGPRNLLASVYIATPIGITVEGANILTRTLMIFGQGALRAHPYAYKEVLAAENNDVKAFDRALWGHVGHIVRNSFRSVLLSLTRGHLTCGGCGPLSKYVRRLHWVSSSFAIMADLAMGSLGGSLKLKEKITGRFADILSWMYLSTAVIRRYDAEGQKKEDLPLAIMALETSFAHIQNAFDGIFSNLNVPGLTWFFRIIIRNWSRLNSLGSGAPDFISHKVAQLMQEPGSQRERLMGGVFVSKDPQEALTRLENAFKKVKEAEVVEKKIRKAIKDQVLPRKKVIDLISLALDKKVISKEESALFVEADRMQNDAMQVDSFNRQDYLVR